MSGPNELRAHRCERSSSSKGLREIALVVALFAAGAAMPGCLVNGSSRETTSGKFVSRNTLSQIEPGVTDEKWILGVLGEPDSRSDMSDGSQIWKWSYSNSTASNSSVFLLFGGSSSKKTERSTFVQMRDCVVVKAWQD